MTIVVIASNVLVGLPDECGRWHVAAVAILGKLQAVDVELVFLDCVISEVIGVIARRVHEQKRSDQLDALLNGLAKLIPAGAIAWVSGESERLYDEVLALIRRTGGELGFHDALIALVCRERSIPVIISFDHDFDRIAWLTRIGTAEEVL